MAKTTKAENANVVETVVESVESEYSLLEFVKNSHIFNTSPEVVAVALREKKIVKATKTEAEKIVKEFLGRKV